MEISTAAHFGWRLSRGGAPTNHDLLIQACAYTDSFIYRDKDGN